MPPKRTTTSTRTPPSTAGSEGSQRRRSARKSTQADASWTLPSLPDSILMRPPERWVCVHFKLLHVSLLDDVVRLPPTATLHTLEAKLIAHHGGAVKGIELYKDDTQPKNKLRDFSLTLKEAFRLDDAHPATVMFPNIPSSSGVGPALVLSPEDHHVTVCYDFKSHDSDCPLLNRSPRYRSGQPPYGSTSDSSAGNTNPNNTSSAGQQQHSSTSRFLNQTTTSSKAAAGGAESPSSTADQKKPGSAGGHDASSPNSTTAAADQSTKDGVAESSSAAPTSVGLSAPLTISGTDGVASSSTKDGGGVGVGSGRGGSGR